MQEKQINIAFICLGNICRSPTAEAVMKALLADANIDYINVQSFATSTYEIGNPPDSRACQIAKENGIELKGVSEQLKKSMANDFKYFFVMDQYNLNDTIKIVGIENSEKVKLLPEFSQDDSLQLIEDPYYGDIDSFRKAFNQINKSCEGLLNYLLSD